jgi:hypothetical protein
MRKTFGIGRRIRIDAAVNDDLHTQDSGSGKTWRLDREFRADSPSRWLSGRWTMTFVIGVAIVVSSAVAGQWAPAIGGAVLTAVAAVAARHYRKSGR